MLDQIKVYETVRTRPAPAEGKNPVFPGLGLTRFAYKGRPAARPAEPPKAPPPPKPAPQPATGAPEPTAPKPQEPKKH